MPAALAAPGINDQLPFFGTLQNTGGTNLSGTYDMTFRVYDAASGGAVLATSVHTAANGNPVTVTNGEFYVLLGSGAGNDLSGVNFNDDTLFVGLTVSSDSEMTPRTRLGAAPYAFNADTVDGLHADDFAQNSGGTNGYVLQSDGTSSSWVSTSSLGITGGGSSLFTDGGATTYLTATGDNLAIGNTGASAPLHVGNQLTNRSVDSVVLISRDVDDASGAGNGHAFSDSSDFSRSGGVAYNSYDARITISGTNSFDHYAAFQAAPVYGSTGTLDDYYGIYSDILVTDGTVVDSFALFASNANVSGAGQITNQYGLFIDNMLAGTNNFSIFTGSAQSLFGGDVIIRNPAGTAGTGSNLLFNSGSGVTGTNMATISHELLSGVRGRLNLGARVGGAGIENVLSIDGSSGIANVGIATTTPSAKLTVDGTVRLATITGGTLETDALGNVTVSSDERLKDIQGAYNAGLNEVLSLNPIVYNWNEDSGYDMSTAYAGFSAQNVEAFLPEAVGENGQGFKTLSTRPILAAVVNSIKEIWDTITGHERRIEALELGIPEADLSRMVDIETELETLRASSSVEVAELESAVETLEAELQALRALIGNADQEEEEPVTESNSTEPESAEETSEPSGTPAEEVAATSTEAVLPADKDTKELISTSTGDAI